MTDRKYLPTLSELIDRLSIVQLKEVFIPEHKEEYSNYRKGIKDGNNLELTHGINGIRNTAKNKIQEIVGGRKDYKIDCLAAEFKDWEVSW